MKTHLLTVTILLLVLFCFVSVFNVSAQTGGVTDRDIAVNLSPESPGPNQNVNITLESFSTNLNKATFVWSEGGKQKLTGVGKTKFSFTTGEIGTKTEISVYIIVEEGGRIDKKISIEPAQVDMLWEAIESYAPPFYKGKTMASGESKVKVIALPVDSDRTVKPETKVYNWKKNYVVDQPSSGYGKYFFINRNSYLDMSDNVGVSVSALSGSGGGVGSLVLSYIKPEILFYENNPAYGPMYNRLLNNGFSLKKGETNIVAEPFYFTERDGSVISSNLKYAWKINNQMIDTPATPNRLTVRSSGDSGIAKVNLEITNTMTLFQEAKGNMEITLGQ